MSQETGDMTDGQVKGRQTPAKSHPGAPKKDVQRGCRKEEVTDRVEPGGPKESLVLEFMSQGLAHSCTHSELEEQAAMPVWRLL